MDWNNYRRSDGSIDLIAVWEIDAHNAGVPRNRAVRFLQHVEWLQPINSRQAAALAVAQATQIALSEERGG